MDFINTQVDLNGLPAVEDISLQPIQPAFKKIMRFEWLISTIILFTIAGLLIFFIPSLRNSFGWIFLVAPIAAICIYHFFSIERSFPFLAYAVRTKDVIYQRGWLIRSVRICPFNRIQNCSVQTGPLERKYGLASLVIYTAGAEGSDMKIPGLVHEEAERLRTFILEKIHTEPDERD